MSPLMGVVGGKYNVRGRAVDPIVFRGTLRDVALLIELAGLGFTWLTRGVHDTVGSIDADHIVVRGCATSRPAAAKAHDATGASDHSPVWTTVQPCS
jgi:hypothetical protein